MKILNGEAQLKRVLTVTMHVLGGLAVAVVLAAVLAAPGFLGGSASTVEPAEVSAIATR